LDDIRIDSFVDTVFDSSILEFRLEKLSIG
jgi:hypothetical protein